jgi:hypothetical protein
MKVTARVDVPLSREEAETYVGKEMQVSTPSGWTTGLVTGASESDGVVWLHIQFELYVKVIPSGLSC